MRPASLLLLIGGALALVGAVIGAFDPDRVVPVLLAQGILGCLGTVYGLGLRRRGAAQSTDRDRTPPP